MGQRSASSKTMLDITSHRCHSVPMLPPLKLARVYCRIMAMTILVSPVLGADSIVINEIHYNPDVKTEPAEFVELYNAGSNAVNLAGWRFTGGLDFIFPATKYGAAGALGPFKVDGSSALSKYGGKLTLRNAAGDIVDEVEYQLGFP